MTALVATIAYVLLLGIIILISFINDVHIDMRRDDPDFRVKQYRRSAVGLLVFAALFFALTFGSAYWYKDFMLGYGPHKAASEHGPEIDSLFNITLFFTGLVFVLATAALFWFAYKYRHVRGRVASQFAHSTKLEMIWTMVPALVMTILVVKGIVSWNQITADVSEGEEYLEIDITGQQFLWYIRYPGKDGKLGAKDFRLIEPGINELGQDWNDKRNHDDFFAEELILPKGRKIKLRIYAKDVLHSVFLPHFRVKMDAVPGMPTYAVFTPTMTTEEYRRRLAKTKTYQRPADPDDPESDPLWKVFDYELACAELCGIGHSSMRRVVKVVEPEEFDKWYNEQKSYYKENIRFTDSDPYKDELLPEEISQRKSDFESRFNRALNAEEVAKRSIELRYIEFKTGSAELSPLSRYELDFVVEALKAHPNIRLEIAGHTDNVGNEEMNQKLSLARAKAVFDYFVSKGIAPERLKTVGYGSTRPKADNASASGRSANRRIELKIIK